MQGVPLYHARTTSTDAALTPTLWPGMTTTPASATPAKLTIPRPELTPLATGLRSVITESMTAAVTIPSGLWPTKDTPEDGGILSRLELLLSDACTLWHLKHKGNLPQSNQGPM